MEVKEPPKCYKLLNLEEKGWLATEEDIKTAFRKLSLQLHPDKAAQVKHSKLNLSC